jgi:hypothetical protein
MGSGAADPASDRGGCGIPASYDGAHAMVLARSSMGSVGLSMGLLAFFVF